MRRVLVLYCQLKAIVTMFSPEKSVAVTVVEADDSLLTDRAREKTSCKNTFILTMEITQTIRYL